MRRALPSLICAGLLALGASGCFFETDDDDRVIVVPARTGALTVNWTIAGTVDPAACALSGADAFELVVYDDFGRFVTEAEAPCESFFISIELDDGFYSADATLVDVFDGAVTVTAPLENLDIIADTELVIDLDFPSSSFL